MRHSYMFPVYYPINWCYLHSVTYKIYGTATKYIDHRWRHPYGSSHKTYWTNLRNMLYNCNLTYLPLEIQFHTQSPIQESVSQVFVVLALVHYSEKLFGNFRRRGPIEGTSSQKAFQRGKRRMRGWQGGCDGQGNTGCTWAAINNASSRGSPCYGAAKPTELGRNEWKTTPGWPLPSVGF